MQIFFLEKSGKFCFEIREINQGVLIGLASGNPDLLLVSFLLQGEWPRCIVEVVVVVITVDSSRPTPTQASYHANGSLNHVTHK